MPITNSKRAKINPATSLSNVRIRSSKTQNTATPMLTQKVAPAGIYTSKISAVTMSKTQQGEESIDVTYELTDANGKVAQGRIRYPLDSYHFDRLSNALVAAGLPNGSPIVDAIGVTEEIELVYPQKNSLAKIKSRRPLAASAVPTQKAAARPKAVPAEDDAEDEDDYDEDDEEDLLDVDDDF